jgi:hypothetical protein
MPKTLFSVVEVALPRHLGEGMLRQGNGSAGLLDGGSGGVEVLDLDREDCSGDGTADGHVLALAS